MIAAYDWLQEFGGEDEGDKARFKRERLGLPPVPEVQIDGVTAEILNAYSVISRERRFAGQSGVPLPIAISDIDAYTTSRGTGIDRDEFDAAIFTLDNRFRAKWAEEEERKRKRDAKK